METKAAEVLERWGPGALWLWLVSSFLLEGLWLLLSIPLPAYRAKQFLVPPCGDLLITPETGTS